MDRGYDRGAFANGYTYALHRAVSHEGEVRKVDRSGGKVTIRHGELRNLDMPAMTMVFRVKDPAMLADLKEGTGSGSLRRRWTAISR